MTAPLHMLAWDRRTMQSWGGAESALDVVGMLRALRRLTHGSRDGVVILSTCERFEIYVSGRIRTGEIIRAIFGHAAGAAFKRVTVSSGTDVQTHLLRVASGLDSRLLGETHVLGQVRRAADAARQTDTIGKHLGRLFDCGVRCGKRVRNETALGRAGATYAGLAAERIARETCHISSPSIAIIGTGAVAMDVGEGLRAHAIDRITVLGRHERRTQNLAHHIRATPASLDSLALIAPALDAIVTATSAPRHIIGPPDLDWARAGLVLLDLGMPENIAPDAYQGRPITYIGLDDLVPGDAPAHAIVHEAEAIIDEELARFTDHLLAHTHREFLRQHRVTAEATL